MMKSWPPGSEEVTAEARQLPLHFSSNQVGFYNHLFHQSAITLHLQISSVDSRVLHWQSTYIFPSFNLGFSFLSIWSAKECFGNRCPNDIYQKYKLLLPGKRWRRPRRWTSISKKLPLLLPWARVPLPWVRFPLPRARFPLPWARLAKTCLQWRWSRWWKARLEITAELNHIFRMSMHPQ